MVTAAAKTGLKGRRPRQERVSFPKDRMKLMIVESPNKIKKIKGILDSLGESPGGTPGAVLSGGRGGWEVAASVGHIRDLPEKELGIAMPAYTPDYELTERGRDVVQRLKSLAARADQVYLATDPDREGEAISWHLKEVLKLRRYQRVTFDAVTTAVIAKALSQPRQIDDHLVQAQEARRVLDRLVGYQVSPVLSRQTGRRGLSAGRVQSPAVRLVVDREREIEAFRETKHFGAEVSFDSNAWRAQWETAPFLPKGEKYLMDQSLAERAARCREFRVDASENKHATQAPPPPFTTSTMLQAASVSLGLKPDVTAQLAQKLFDAGLITYHRTDSQNFSAEALKEVREFAAKRGLPLPASARNWKARGGAQEAHEAIRPTHFADEQAGEDRLQQALYRLIWMRAVASQLADAEYSVNTLRLAALGETGAAPDGRRFTFKAVGRTLIAPGWMSLTAKDEAEEDEPAREGDGGCGKVPLLPVGTAARAESGRVLNKKTQPPSRYTQASLIKKLESIGIGRPSTYSAILKNVLTRGYLAEDKKFLIPTELGCLVVDTLEPRFRFLDYAFTRDLEQQLDDIAEGKAEYRDVVAGADAQLQKELAELDGAPRPPMAARFAARSGAWSQTATAGTLERASSAWRSPTGAASTSPESNRRNPLPARKKASSATGAAHAEPAKRTRSRKAAAGAVPPASTPGAGKTAAKKPAPAAGEPVAKPQTLLCPRCKQGELRLSSDEKYYSCARYKQGCSFTLGTIIASRRMKPADLSALCNNGRTGKLSGFLSKTGRPFEAVLVLNETGRVEFSFAPR
jgi:DNA topoisomerase-1